MAHQTADGHNLLRWAKRGLQQPIGMQLLQPLAVQYVRLAPGYILQMPRIHQKDADTALFQDLVQGDPVDPGRLHRHRIHPTGFQPVGQPLQILGKNPKTAYTLFVAVWRHGYIDLLPTDINPGGIRVDLIQRIHHDLSLLHSRFSHVILQMKLNWSRPDQNVQVEYAPKRGPRRATNEKTSMIGTKLASGSNDTSGGTVLTVWTYCLLYPLLPSFFWKEGRCRPGITRNDSHLQFSWIGDAAGEGGGGSHRRGGQINLGGGGAHAAFEVAVTGRQAYICVAQSTHVAAHASATTGGGKRGAGLDQGQEG